MVSDSIVMETSDEQSNNEQRSTGNGPGERLQAARMQQGLSLDDVASRMHLSAAILKAIENNEFEEITAPIFVKGYLRAYARIVSLDEDDMIDQYINFYSKEDPPITSTSNTTSELSTADPRMKWTTYIVVLVIAVSLVAWWWNQQQSDEEPISLDSQSSSLEQPAVAGTEGVNNEIEAASEELIEADETGTAGTAQATSEPAVEVETVAASEPEPTTVSDEEVAVEQTSATVEPEPSAPTDEVVASEVDEGEVIESEVVQSESATGEVVAAENGSLETALGTRKEPSRIAPSGSDKLEIVVHADTWADITDANSYQLVYDLLRADKSVELTGQAPFTVFLGNGHGVEIIYNGDDIAVAPRIRDDNTARLKIGG